MAGAAAARRGTSALRLIVIAVERERSEIAAEHRPRARERGAGDIRRPAAESSWM